MDISGDMRAILVDWMVEVQVGGRGEGAWSFAEQLPPHLVYGTHKHPQCRAHLPPFRCWG